MNKAKKINILLTAGGTATTWHFCNVIKEYFQDEFNITITDSNEKHLVPSSIFADSFYQVPTVFEDNYLNVMYDILKKEHIDYIIPLIDFDLFNFSSDNEKLKQIGVKTTAPELNTIETLTNKAKMFEFLSKNKIQTIQVLNQDDLKDDERYIVKPITGFGSIGVQEKNGKEIKSMDCNNLIIQEKCLPGEITVEVFNGDKLHIFQRRRIQVKSGVCTKMEPVCIKEINESIEKLVKSIKCPKAFCIQYMQNSKKEWCIMDCNLRIGAGTALSTKIGFQLVRALLTDILNKDVSDDLFTVDSKIKSVLRVYKEVAMK